MSRPGSFSIFRNFCSSLLVFGAVFLAAVFIDGVAGLSSHLALAQGLPAPDVQIDKIDPDDQSTDDEIILESTFDLKAYLSENPLAPPDTSSPRASLESFILLMNQASIIWRAVRSDFHASSERFLSDAEQLKLTQVRALLEKASGVFDLSGIPETARDRASLEISLQFQEILDRIYLPNIEDVPGSAAGSFLNSKAIAELPERWTIPGTDLVFERTRVSGAGSRFLLTPESVALVPDDYKLIKAFAPRKDMGDDLYAYYIYTPGNLVAPKWYDLITAGPDWLGSHLLSQAYWQWIGLVVLTILAISVPAALSRWDRMRAVPVAETFRRLRSLQLPILIIATIMVYRYLVEDQINITGNTMIVVGTVSTALVWTCLGWLIYRLIDLATVWIIRNPMGSDQPMDSSLMLTAFRLFGLVAALIITGYGATRIGIPVYGVIAGLGVGGLAVALAAQPTLENLIGGIILYADKMVRVGEFCEFDDLSGTVEAIGIRSTRIRALDRTVITISNADLAKRKIINYSRRDQYLLRHKLGLRYETSKAQLSELIEDIRSYLEDHEMVAEAPLRVRFVGMGSYSLDVEVYAYIKTADRALFLEIQESMLLKFMEIVRNCGADFAFPSSTTYLAQDGEKAPAWPPASSEQQEALAADDPDKVGTVTG